MAYLTTAQATAILEAEGNTRTWGSLSSTDKGRMVEKATRRIESIPFRMDEELGYRDHERFLDGKYTDSNGAAIADQTMPKDLQIATATLARWYSDNENVEDITVGEGDIADDSLTPFMQDIPISIQTALWNYLSDEAKGINHLALQTDIAREKRQQEIALNIRTGRNFAAPITYT